MTVHSLLQPSAMHSQFSGMMSRPMALCFALSAGRLAAECRLLTSPTLGFHFSDVAASLFRSAAMGSLKGFFLSPLNKGWLSTSSV